MPDKELTEQQMVEKINKKQEAKVQQFVTEYNALSKKHGFTFQARPVILDNGTVGAQLVPVKVPVNA